MECFLDYYDPVVRGTCHLLKDSQNNTSFNEAIQEVAIQMVKTGMVGINDILIPAPGHEGRSTYTRYIAGIVAYKTGAHVADILRCEPHEPLYDIKTRGEYPHIRFYLEGKIPKNKRLFFVDNVIATGYTFLTADGLFNGKLIPLVYAVDYEMLRLSNPALSEFITYIKQQEKRRII